MGWVFAVLALTLGAVFVWGVVAPQTLWRVLSAWSVSDEHRSEPGGAAYGWNRLVAGLGLVSLVTVAGVALAPGWVRGAEAAPGLTAIEQMWGSPEPTVINRAIAPVAAPPGGLTEMPVLGYQAFDDEDGPPDYLVDLREFTMLGTSDISGYIGSLPETGYSAADFSDIVLNVRGPILCVPRQLLVIETEESIQVAVYYGLPDPSDGSIPDNAVSCAADATLTASVLIPISLSGPVGERKVISLDGTELKSVELP